MTTDVTSEELLGQNPNGSSFATRGRSDATLFVYHAASTWFLLRVGFVILALNQSARRARFVKLRLHLRARPLADLGPGPRGGPVGNFAAKGAPAATPQGVLGDAGFEAPSRGPTAVGGGPACVGAPWVRVEAPSRACVRSLCKKYTATTLVDK
mmetsp:Transcript_30693/g.94957  ORF Transcript_30693/g.94957 Transcript_30693/m.94957 type:complete len:154 (+) Transcript_30693:1516-1977(+)